MGEIAADSSNDKCQRCGGLNSGVFVFFIAVCVSTL